MSTQYENRRLAELAARISEIDLAIAELNIEYDNTAVRFSGTGGQDNGNPEILKQAAAIEEKISWLVREKQLAENATKQAEIGAKREAETRELEERRARATTARELASAITTINHELDDALLALRQLFERRHSLLRELQTTSVANTVATKLMSKSVATRAACFAGIHIHLDIHRCAPGSFLSLGSADPVLQSIGRELPDPAPALTSSAEFLSSNGGSSDG
jgi:hypothetical protein